MKLSFKKSWTTLFLILVFAQACQWLKKSSLNMIGPASDRKNTIIVGMGDFPAQLDTTKIKRLSEATLEVNLFEGLVGVEFLKSSFEFVPRLAKDIKVSSDGLEYVFELRDGVKWSDGQPLTAQHFVDAFEILLRGENKDLAREYFAIKNARGFAEGDLKKFNDVGVVAEGETTLKIKLAHRENFFLNLLYHPAVYPVRKEFVGNIKDWARLYQRIPTLGPFVISQVDPGKKIILEKNPNYPFSRPNVEAVEFKFGFDPQSAFHQLTEGKVDVVAGLPQDRWSGVQQKTIVVPSFDWTLGILGFNVKQKPFDNPIVRRALGMALNREELIGSQSGHVSAFSSVIPPGYAGFESNRGIRYDPTAGLALTKKSGSGKLEKYLPFRIKYEDSGRNREYAENIAQQLKKNLEVDVEVVGTGFWDKVEKGEPPTMYLLTVTPFIPDPQALLSMFDSGDISKLLSWRNQNYSEFVRDSGRDKAEKSQARFFSKAQHLLLEKDAAVIPLYLDSQPAIFNGRVKNIPESFLGAVPLSQVTVE